ncbi:MAG: YihY/virulence factor BrkB family protein [Gemmatimonadota bacterium]|nr:YihY/virulence factor BrkB family protein [Gemmatimonadota bacterium]
MRDPRKHVEPHHRKLVVAGYDVVVLARKTLAELLQDNLMGMSAAAAYSFFFGLFPTFLLAAPVLSTFGNKQQLFDRLFTWMASALPPAALDLVQAVLKDVIFAPGAPGLMSVGALLALFAGANMFSTLSSALNAAYEVHETRPWWRVELLSIGATIVCAVTIGAAVALLMGGDALLSWFTTTLHLGEGSEVLSAIAQYVLTIVLMVGSVWCIYMLLPDVQAQNGLQTLVGAGFATALWIIVTLLFRAYVIHFGAYNKTYGTVGAVIVLLTWMYLSMLAILVGGELNSELRRGTGTTAIKSQGLAAGTGDGGRVSTHPGVPHPSCELG